MAFRLADRPADRLRQAHHQDAGVGLDVGDRGGLKRRQWVKMALPVYLATLGIFGIFGASKATFEDGL